MTIHIGNNLKQLRLKKGLTQEQAAAVFGISPQAVSRWENNTAYPDITLLPGLAIFYNTSVDAIVGMDKIRQEETLWKIHTEINRLVIHNQTDQAISLIRDSLKIYPNDSGLLMSLGETLALQSENPDAAIEAISIAERILQMEDVSIKAKSTTSANLLFLYLRVGQKDQAEKLLRSLPHIWESREILMPEVSEGKEYSQALKNCIMKVLCFLCQKIDATHTRQPGATPAYIQLGVDFTHQKSAGQMLDQIRDYLEA